MKIEDWDANRVARAIQGRGTSTRIGRGRHVVRAQIHERVKVYHAAGHVVSPLESLWTEVNEEGVRGPPSHDHDLGGGVVLEEHGHGGARTDRSVPALVRVEAKNSVFTKQGTGAAEQEFGELVCKEQGGGDRAEQSVGGPAWNGAEDALDCSYKTVDGAEEGVFGPFL